MSVVILREPKIQTELGYSSIQYGWDFKPESPSSHPAKGKSKLALSKWKMDLRGI